MASLPFRLNLQHCWASAYRDVCGPDGGDLGNNIYNQFLSGRSGAEACPAYLSLTLTPPNKVTPVRGFLLISPHYVQYSRKRLAAGLSGVFSRYPFGFKG
jgi:hypothetical protein